nr:twitching motility protein [Klebsiella pneumoniae]
MATLHTRGAAPAVERLIDVFPAEEKDQVRSQLAGSLCAVLAQNCYLHVRAGELRYTSFWSTRQRWRI